MKARKEVEEIQSRRDFFKKTAQRVLPFIAALAFIDTPFVARAAEIEPMGCRLSCVGSCEGYCSGTCKNDCLHSCKGCQKSCSGSCSDTCSGTCSGGSR